MKKLIDLEVDPSLSMAKKQEQLREALKGMFPGKQVICVGFEFHFVVDDVLASLSGWTSGFNREDYES